MKKSFKITIIAAFIGLAFAFAPPEPVVTTLRIIGGGSQDYPLIKIEFYDLMVSQTVPRQTVSGGAEYFNLSTIYSLTQAESGHYKMKVYYRDNANLGQSDSSISIENLKIMAKAFAEETDCTKVPLTSAEYLECFNCVALTEYDECTDKYGTVTLIL